MKQLPRNLVIGLTLAWGIGLAIPTTVEAQDSTPVVEYRQGLMQAFRIHMGGVRAAMSDTAPMGHAEHHAVSFERMALALANTFPEGSLVPESRALPAIWENRDDFMDKVTDLQTASARLVTAAGSGDPDQIGSAMEGIRATCGGCHRLYRGPAN